MALKRTVQKLTASYVTLYTCPAGTDAAVQSLVIANPLTVNGSFTVRYFNASTATTEILLPSTDVLIGATYSYPRSINLKTGDYIEALGTVDLTVQLSVYELATTANGFTPQGAWNSATTYTQNDVVTYNNSSYVATQTGSNKNPATQTAYWTLLAAQGVAATLDVGATTVVNPNVNPSVTNSGTVNDAVFEFDLPRAPAVVVNAVTTVNPNVNPSVADTGTNGDSSLTFSIPRAPAVASGTVTTLAGGASATVTTVVETDGDVVLNFGIPQGIGYAGLTSTSSVAIGTGSKTFTTNLSASQTAFSVGMRIRVSSSATPVNFMEGIITAFSTTTLTMTSDLVGGSGTIASWNIDVAGQQGIQGNTGNTGATGSASPKAISIASPTASENITLFYTTVAITLSQVIAVVAGTTPSITYSISSAADRSSGSPTVNVNAQAATSTTTGSVATIANASIAANSWVWLTTSASSGTVNRFHVSLIF